MNVNDALETDIPPALIVREPIDQTVEFEIESASIFELGPVPIPQPLDELDAFTIESTIINDLILDSPSEPVPIPDPSDPL
jgi:hypothetical protein